MTITCLLVNRMFDFLCISHKQINILRYAIDMWHFYYEKKGVASPFSEINDAKLEIVLKPEVIDGFCMESHLPPPFGFYLILLY